MTHFGPPPGEAVGRRLCAGLRSVTAAPLSAWDLPDLSGEETRGRAVAELGLCCSACFHLCLSLASVLWVLFPVRLSAFSFVLEEPQSGQNEELRKASFRIVLLRPLGMSQEAVYLRDGPRSALIWGVARSSLLNKNEVCICLIFSAAKVVFSFKR